LDDLEMLLEGGEGCKNLEMLLKDGKTRTRGCKNLKVKNGTVKFFTLSTFDNHDKMQLLAKFKKIL